MLLTCLSSKVVPHIVAALRAVQVQRKGLIKVEKNVVWVESREELNLFSNRDKMALSTVLEIIWEMPTFESKKKIFLFTGPLMTFRHILLCVKCRQEHHLLLEKLSALEKKVIVGGVDLLAKAEEQEKLLQESNNELEERRRRAEQLRRELEEKEVTP